MSHFLPRKYQAFIFDLDGVLVDSYECWWHLVQSALGSQGKAPISREAFDASWGQGVEDDRKMFFPEWTLQEVLQYYEQNFSHYTGFLKSIPHAKTTLMQLKAQGKKIAIATNSPSFVLNGLLDEMNLAQYVDASAAIDEVADGKPAPDLIYKAMEDLRVSTSEVCYVGDSIFDEKAARSAGVYFVGFQRPGDITIQSLAELL